MIVQIYGDGHRGLLAVVEAKTIREALKQYAVEQKFIRPRLIQADRMKAEGRLYVGQKA